MRTDANTLGRAVAGLNEAAFPAHDRVTQTEAAQIARCSVRYLQKLAKDGRGPARFRWAGRVWYSRAGLQSFFARLERGV